MFAYPALGYSEQCNKQYLPSKVSCLLTLQWTVSQAIPSKQSVLFTYPTVDIVTNDHQNPSRIPLKNDRGKCLGLDIVSCKRQTTFKFCFLTYNVKYKVECYSLEKEMKCIENIDTRLLRLEI